MTAGSSIRDRIKQCHKETIAFFIFLIIIGIYYGYRMFALEPWYDEIYTYYFFISKGPAYAAIHWPLPNNHVLFSVLSAVLNWFGNPYIGLRGISYLCAIGNLILLYCIGCRVMKRGLAFGITVLYSSMDIVNYMAIQGRGYTLATFAYLLAIYAGLMIVTAEKKKYYIVFSLSLVAGLYTIPTSIYWVLPVCIAAGLTLLLLKRWKTLGRLIGAGGAAAGLTIFLYSILWGAVGCNLLTDDATSQFYGQGHISTLLQAPVHSLVRGFRFMVDNPYVETYERAEVLESLPSWMQGMFHNMYTNSGIFLYYLFLAGIIYLLLYIFYQYRQTLKEENALCKQAYSSEENEKSGCDEHSKEAKLYIALYLCVSCICIPVFLIVQCVLPFTRVFSFAGVIVALFIAFLANELIIKNLSKKRGQLIVTVIAAGLSLLCIMNLTSHYYNKEYSEREPLLADAMEKIQWEVVENFCYTDEYQKYTLKFHWDKMYDSCLVTDADCLVVDRMILDSNQEAPEWPAYFTKDTIFYDDIEENMTEVYSNRRYAVFVRKGMEDSLYTGEGINYNKYN